jgi:hypothetical protein
MDSITSSTVMLPEVEGEEEGNYVFVNSGNINNQYLGISMDMLAIAMHELGSIS